MMLNRQKVVIRLLLGAGGRLTSTKLVKLLFLLRQECLEEDLSFFYDFVPYKFGPFSFSLYRELSGLERDSIVSVENSEYALLEKTSIALEKLLRSLPTRIVSGVDSLLDRFGAKRQNDLIRYVYHHYPQFAINSEHDERRRIHIDTPKPAELAIYTAGYEGKSVDGFLYQLIEKGIRSIIDVRANPVSRRYGFAGSRLKELCEKLSIIYYHRPAVGIPSAERTNLSDVDSYRVLLDRYEQLWLPQRENDVKEIGSMLTKQPSVLVCVEADSSLCHRGRLAPLLKQITGLEVIHL